MHAGEVIPQGIQSAGEIGVNLQRVLRELGSCFVITLGLQPKPSLIVQLGVARIHRQQIVHRGNGIEKMSLARRYHPLHQKLFPRRYVLRRKLRLLHRLLSFHRIGCQHHNISPRLSEIRILPSGFPPLPQSLLNVKVVSKLQPFLEQLGGFRRTRSHG